VLGIWFGKDNINTNWIQIQNKVKIQFEKLKDRKLSLKHKVLIINTYILSKILYVARIVPRQQNTHRLSTDTYVLYSGVVILNIYRGNP
jgi:hypothetical protein